MSDSVGFVSPMVSIAERYLERGWRVLPIPYRQKRPTVKGWQTLEIEREELQRHFIGVRLNIGVLLGDPSNGLIDVDLDHPRAVALAEQYLPPTGLVFGRPGKPRSHWLYRVSGPIQTKKYKSKQQGMIVELRSTGCQTVVPPSTHVSGEAITWEDEAGEPAEVAAADLRAAVRRLAEAVLRELGEAVDEERNERPVSLAAETFVPLDERRKRCLAAMLRLELTDSRDGSGRLFAIACRAVEHDLDDESALRVIAQYSQARPFPKTWSDDEIARRLRDAEQKTVRGRAVRVDLDLENCVPLGARDPVSGRLVLSPKRTLPTAQAYIDDFHRHPEGQTLFYHEGRMVVWRDNRYIEIEDAELNKRLLAWLHQAVRYRAGHDGELVLADFEANPTTVKAALESVRSYTFLPSVRAPAWLGDADDRPPPEEIVACRTGLLHLPTMRSIEPTPTFYTNCAIDFDHDPQAPEPTQWHSFLHQLFDGDLESLDLLQEWFGYCLVGDTRQQKMLLMVGPKRSGKGTVARVLRRLVGEVNACGPTTSSLASNFGLQPLLGKSLAIVSDARFHGENIITTVERLLCITGEDPITVDRKHLPAVTLPLSVRFMFLSNELPRFNDASGALAGRFLILKLTESFYGREDVKLTEKLFEELPGILNWAIEGWQRLRERGHFVMPASVTAVVQELEDLGSPVGAFVREECTVGVGQRVYIDDLYRAWRDCCERNGRKAIGSVHTFGRDLIAAVPGIATRRNQQHGRFYDGIGLRCATHVPTAEAENAA